MIRRCEGPCGNTFDAKPGEKVCDPCVNSAENQAAMLVLLKAIAETVRDAGELGAPTVSIYLALQQRFPGFTADQLEAMIRPLVLVGIFERQRDTLWLGPQGPRFLGQVRQ